MFSKNKRMRRFIMDKGKFIVFEGIDGSGKGTQIIKAASFIFSMNKNNDVFITREPTRDFEVLRKRMKKSKSVSENAEWYADFFVKDRKNHVDKYIVPALNNGTHVLCDRYKYSTLAYQQTQGMSFEELNSMHEGVLVPDLVLLFDCPALVAAERRKERKEGDAEVFDKANQEWIEKLRQNYLDCKKNLREENIVIIDATNSIENIHNQVKCEIEKIIKY